MFAISTEAYKNCLKSTTPTKLLYIESWGSPEVKKNIACSTSEDIDFQLSFIYAPRLQEDPRSQMSNGPNKVIFWLSPQHGRFLKS